MEIAQALKTLWGAGGPVFLVLAACSVVTLTVVLERGWFYWKNRVDYRKLFSGLAPTSGEQALQLCREQEKGSEIFACLFATRNPGKRKEALEIALESEKLRRENYLPVLATLAVIAPFLGLLGTVSGIMKTFRDIAVAGNPGPAVIAAGVSEALVTTFLGLLVAILAVSFFNWFKSLNQRYLAQAANLARRLAMKIGEEQS